MASPIQPALGKRRDVGTARSERRKHGGRSGFVDLVNHAHDVMAEHLHQKFVHLRRPRLAADLVAELALDGREGRLHVAPCVIRRKEFFAVHAEEVEQARPHLRLDGRTASRRVMSVVRTDRRSGAPRPGAALARPAGA